MTGLIAGTCEFCLDCSLGLLLLFWTFPWTAATPLGLLPASWTGCLSVSSLLFILLWTHLLPPVSKGGATCSLSVHQWAGTIFTVFPVKPQ